MNSVKTLAVSLFIVFCIQFSAFAAPEDAFNNIYKKVDSYLELAERNKKSKQDRWYPQPFTDTNSSLNKKLNKLLDSALEGLLDGRLLTLKYNITALKQKNTKLKKEIADYEIRKITAPQDKKLYEVWKKDAEDFEKKIVKMNHEIDVNVKKIEENKGQMLTLLQEEGIAVSPDDVNSLVETVDGDDTVKAMVVLQNVQIILNKLQGVLEKSGENIDIAKKYYGIHLLSTHTYYYMLSMQRNKILTQYIPKLKKIREENRALMARTQQLANTDPAVLGNLETQKSAEEAAKAYEAHLLQQVRNLDKHIEKVDVMLKRAFNTYETVSLAHNLSEIVTKSINEYEALMSLKLFDPIPFKNTQMKSKISEITAKLE